MIMSAIQPKGERVRKAVQWISEGLLESERIPVDSLIQEAALKFNLSPKEEEELKAFYGKKEFRDTST
jgi:hypothetical protein